MWQPRPVQWAVIAITAIVLVAGWPPEKGRSLGVKAINWIVDPADALPSMPAALPMALDDNGDAVAEHDALARDYYNALNASRATRWRMKLKETGEPLDPVTERQLLVGIGVLSALLVWRLSAVRADP
jgi:hypothetical protein